MTSPALLDILKNEELVTDINCRMLKAFMKRWDMSALHAILQTKLISESDLADAMARTLGLNRLFHCETLPVEPEALALVSFAKARRWECMPVSLTEGRDRLELVVADPTRQERYRELSNELETELVLAVAERSDIVGAIDELYPLAEQLPELFGK